MFITIYLNRVQRHAIFARCIEVENRWSCESVNYSSSLNLYYKCELQLYEEKSDEYDGWVEVYDKMVLTPDKTKFAYILPANEIQEGRNFGWWNQVALIDINVRITCYSSILTTFVYKVRSKNVCYTRCSRCC